MGRNMHSKVGRGQKKKYFKSGAKKRRYDLDLMEGGDVVFECRNSIFVGRGASKLPDNSYSVHSENFCREHNITWQSHPVMLADLHVPAEEVVEGQTYLVVWQLLDDYMQLIPAQLVAKYDDYAWMTPDPSVHDGSLKVQFDNILGLNRDKHKINLDIAEAPVSLDHNEVSVAWLLLHTTQTQLDNMSATYRTTLQQLNEQTTESQKLQEQISTLNNINQEAMQAIDQYRTDLMKAESMNQAANTLYKVIAKQKDRLDTQEKQLLECDKIIEELHEAYALQQEELDNATAEIERLNGTVADLRAELVTQKCTVDAANNKDTFTIHQNASSGHITARPAGSQRRGTTFLPVSRPSILSSLADRRTLSRRADQIDKVLKAISAKENPTPEDIISTLAAYLRRHPEIAIPAYQSAKITFSQELNTKETVDLKILLKLPMKKLRDLRRFLSNHNIKILPSERHIYSELKARQSLTPEIVEIGIMQLKQPRATNSLPTSIGYARVKNLKEYLEDLITTQHKNNNLWTDQAFQDELWLKIGGDKGGSSTKLTAQFVNQKNGNSADATNILAMFNGTDSYDNMSEVFSVYFEQFAELMQIRTLNVDGQTKRLRIFLIGDYEFLTKYLGHMGACSSYPCIWCNITLDELRKPTNGNPHSPKLKDHNWAENANWPKERTTAQYLQDVADMKSYNGTRNITGHMYHSISKQPLFPLSDGIDHVVPPALHILLGLVVRYFNLLELECRKLDQGGLAEQDLAHNDEWQQASERSKIAEIELNEAKAALEADEDLLKSFVRSKRGRDVQGLTSDPCSMPICGLTSSVPPEVDRKNVQWIRCTNCGEGDDSGWYHAYCAGIKENEVADPKYNDWTCQICEDEVAGPDDVIPFQEQRVISNKALVKEKLTIYEHHKEQLDKVFEQIRSSRGNYESALNSRLENDLKVKRQAYHSQCFVGNHCKKIVDNCEVLLDVLPDGEVKNKFLGLFGRLRQIFRYFKAGFLTEDEIKQLRIRCWELGYFFPKHFPDETIPPKLHILICHIPELAMRWKTIGLLSEQGLEGVHACINSIERVYCTVRDKRENMRLVFGCHQASNATAKEGIQVLPKNIRSCIGNERCKGRYKMVNEQLRQCQKCGHKLDIK